MTRGPVTIQTDSVMARVSEATAQHLRDALDIQRRELTREWEDRLERREREEAEAQAKARERADQERRAALRHWTGLVSFVFAALGALGAAYSWWAGKIRAEAREECVKDALGDRVKALESVVHQEKQ